MKNMLRVFAMLSMLASGPSLAKEVSEFPSRSIHTVTSNAQADHGFDQAPQFGGAAPQVDQKTLQTPPTPLTNARSSSALSRDGRNAQNQRAWQHIDGNPAPSQIPQLHALSQHRLQCPAP